MESLTELFRIGIGPSSTHTMASRRASQMFLRQNPGDVRFRVTLFGSLAATGKGHLTDVAVNGVFSPRPVEIVYSPLELPKHPNGMEFEAFDAQGNKAGFWRVYSTGGGALADDEDKTGHRDVYDRNKMDALLDWSSQTGKPSGSTSRRKKARTSGLS